MEAIAIEWVEWAVHSLLFWEEDPKRKGKILRSFHHFFMHALLVMIIISHTLYPTFFLQTIILGICICIWIQHILTNGCVVSKVEQKLLQDSENFVDPILEIFHIIPTREISIAIVILGSTLTTLLLTLEWISRVSHKCLKFMEILPSYISLTTTFLKNTIPQVHADHPTSVVS